MNIIKLGGSTITDKSVYKKFNARLSKRMCEEILKARQKLIIIHGAGSFGHISAVKFGLDKPGSISGREREIASVMNDALILNSRIVDTLNKTGVKAISVAPHSIYKEGIADFGIIERLLETGFVPVLYGDIIISAGKYRIISGDELALDLARRFLPESVAFVTDVDGIFDRDPKVYRNAALIGNIRSGSLAISSPSKDATGSMSGKIKRIKRMIGFTKRVWIINGKYPERIGNYLEGKEVLGTVIT